MKSMTNYFEFVESRDIREHLEKIGYQLNALEAGFLVWRSRQKSLEEKLRAWQDILDTMPDMDISHTRYTSNFSSFHEALRQFIALQRKSLKVFLDSTDHIYTYRWRERDKKTGRVSETNEDRGAVFTSFEKCLAACKKTVLEDWEAEDSEAEICRYCINTKDDYAESALLNRNWKITEVSVHYEEKDFDLSLLFEGCWLSFPTPFHRGDILRLPTGEPVVLNFLYTWGSERLIEEGISPKYSWVQHADKWIESHKKHGDPSDMNMAGYGMRDGVTLYTDYGGWPNYLDLEYYRQPLKGREKLLALVSEYLKERFEWVDTMVNGAIFLAFQEATNHVEGELGLYNRDYRKFLREDPEPTD